MKPILFREFEMIKNNYGLGKSNQNARNSLVTAAQKRGLFTSFEESIPFSHDVSNNQVDKGTEAGSLGFHLCRQNKARQ